MWTSTASEAALQFIEPCEGDAEAAAAGIDPAVLARANALPGGASLAAKYQVEPQLRLSDALLALKGRLDTTAWARDTASYADEGAGAGHGGLDFELAIGTALRGTVRRAPMPAFRDASLRKRAG